MTPAHSADAAPTPRWRRYLTFFGPRGIADLDDELRFHIEMRVRDYMARGMSEADARAHTARRLGDLATSRDACATIVNRRQRQMTRTQIVDAFVQDVRFAGRMLRRQKGWTAVAVLTLALGIGANTAMFSVVNNLLLHPIPYPAADRIVSIFQAPTEANAISSDVQVSITPSGRLVSAWIAGSRSFEDLEPYRTNDATIERVGVPAQVVHTAWILPRFATFAGQRPLIGRLFTAEEAHAGASVVLLSEGMWRGEFGGDPGVLGRSLTVDGHPLTIIGVMPGIFRLQRSTDGAADLWLPLDLARSDDAGLQLVGRLRPRVTREAAVKELDGIADAQRDRAPNAARYVTKLVRPQEMISYRDSLVLLTVAVGLVLLIACANVAHLLLARAAARERELAIRVALGAGGRRLFRQLVTESLVLAVSGCAGGLLVGWAGLRLLVSAAPGSLADLSAARLDGDTLLVTAALSIATGVAFGLIGLLQALRHSTHDSLKAGAPGASIGRGRGRLRAALVVTEMALCTALLIGATLLVRSVAHLQSEDPGFDAHGLYAASLVLPDDRYADDKAKEAFFQALTDRVRGVPGVEDAVLTTGAPPSWSFTIGALQMAGDPDPAPSATGLINYTGVPPRYFKLMRMPILQGHVFSDSSSASNEVMVNEGFARKHWPGRSALGQQLRVVYGGQGTWKTVVGVVGNAMTGGLTSEASEPMLFEPGPNSPQPTLIVRTRGDASLLRSLPAIITSMDAHLPPPPLSSVESAMQSTVARPRFTMLLLMIFTIVAVGLAAIGLYGVLAYSVAQRTREIGIRMALGASRGLVARAVLREGLVLALVGAALGLAAARAGAGLIGSVLYGVSRTDAVAFVSGTAILVLIALAACIVPVRRALAVDPLIAMRAD